MSTFFVRPVFRVMVLLGLAGLSGVVHGAEIQAEVRSRAQMTPADTGVIQAYVDENAAGLTGEIRAAQQARDRLLEPAAAKVSVAFRLGYSEALAGKLAGLYGHADDRVAFNAIRIAGELASPVTLDGVRAGLGDSRASVRYGAALAARTAFQHAANRNAALTDTQTSDLVGMLTRALTSEADPAGVEGMIAALDAAPQGARLGALQALAGAVSQQARTFGRAGRGGDPAAWAGAFQRAVKTVQSSLLEQMRVGKPDEGFAKASAELCGALLGHAKRRAEAGQGEVSEAEWNALGALAADAEGALIFTHLALTGQQQAEQTVKAAWEARDAGRISREIDRWIGAGGMLTKAPYSMSVEKFQAAK